LGSPSSGRPGVEWWVGLRGCCPRERPGVASPKASRAGGDARRQSLRVTVATLRRHGGCGRTLPAVAGPRAGIYADERLQRMLTAIDLKIEVFDRLRSAMRIAEAGGAISPKSGESWLPQNPAQRPGYPRRTLCPNRRSNRSRRTVGGSRLLGESTPENPPTHRPADVPRGRALAGVKL